VPAGFLTGTFFLLSYADEEGHMDKVLEFLNAWMKSQKEFMENWVRSQKEFMANWTDATRKMQEAFLSMGEGQEGTSTDRFNLYKSWLTTMVNSSKVFTDEAGKIQESWKNTVEKQMEMSREMVKNMMELFKQATEKK
jgi:hypothetical protein